MKIISLISTNFSMASNSRTSNYLLVCIAILLTCVAKSCYGSSGTFGFDIHHRYSDHVKALLNIDDLPEKGSPEYYEAMVHNDRFLHSRRRLSETTRLTFFNGNATQKYNSLGFLHYANVSVGTPSVSFLVALDTGSDLFWLPCDCTSCVRSLVRSNGETIILNIYSPNVSSTSKAVPCSSLLCEQSSQCSSPFDNCPYKISYVSYNTSTSGVLVNDLLHLRTDLSSSQTPVDASITFGCGKVQTGSFLEGAAPNGLFGLGMEATSVPTMLATQGLTSNSFSMCFGLDGVGRITFGDQGGLGQGETPFNIVGTHPTYDVTATQIIVGEIVTNHTFSAIFDTGTSFTYFTDPTYTVFTSNFNSQIKETRNKLNLSIPFEFCYDLSPGQTSAVIPLMDMTMTGGDTYSISDYNSIVFYRLKSGQLLYCLAILKSEDIDLIGQNFMTENRIVFDRDRMKLGWKKSNCYHSEESNIPPVTPTASPPPPAVPFTYPPPPVSKSPPNRYSKNSLPPPPPAPALQSNSSRLGHFLAFFTMIFFPLLAFV